MVGPGGARPAALSAAGLGIAMLPPSIYDREQRLRTLTTAPRLAALEFVAAHLRDTASPLTRFVVDMARTVSTFAPRTAGPS